MSYKLNGINYTEMLLTDEELAVVKAMRSEGGRVNLNIFNSNYKKSMEHADSINLDIFPASQRIFEDFSDTDSVNPFFILKIENEKVKITHFIHI